MKKKWAVRPHELWNPGAVEQWLEYEAEKGWYLAACNNWFATLKRGEPRTCRVRIHPQGPERREVCQQRLDAYEEMGWRFAAVVERSMDTEFEVFYCADPAVPELDTDPVVYGMVWEQELKKDERLGVGTLVLAVALTVFLCAVPLLRQETPLQTLLNLTAPILFSLLVLCPLLAVMGLRQLWQTRRARKVLRAGVKPEFSGSWQKSRLWWRVITWLILAYWVLFFCSNVAGVWLKPDMAEGVYVDTSELMPDSREEDWNFEDFQLDSTFLRPQHFRIRLSYADQQRIRNVTDQVRFTFLAKALYQEKLEEFLSAWPQAEQTAVEHEAFDEAVLLHSGEAVQMLLVRSGKTVYSLWVNFPADLAGRVESVAAQMPED